MERNLDGTRRSASNILKLRFRGYRRTGCLSERLWVFKLWLSVLNPSFSLKKKTEREGKPPECRLQLESGRYSLA